MASKRKSFSELSKRAQNKCAREDLDTFLREVEAEAEVQPGMNVVTSHSDQPCVNESTLKVGEFSSCSSDTLNASFSDILASDSVGSPSCAYSGDNDACTNKEFDPVGFKSSLGDWAVNNNIPNSALSSLLLLLKQVPDLSSLPSDPRTLLKTDVSLKVRDMPPGKYHHFGLKNGLLRAVQGMRKIDNPMKVLVGVDGLPLSKSTRSNFWLLLGRLLSVKYSGVFMIGVYHGNEKPVSVNAFLEEFVNEAKHLVTTGLEVPEVGVIPVEISGICCDAPAKAFVLQVKAHSGYSSCTRCTIRGEYKNNRVCFPGTLQTVARRTHEGFLRQEDEDYHSGVSVLQDIPDLDLVYSIPIDYMHLVCHGVMKRLLQIWIGGKIPNRFSSSVVKNISLKLEALAKCIPKEFARKPRNLNDVARWKATEFRQFLLYTGPVVLCSRDISPDILTNFMSLHVALSILLQNSSENLLNYAQSLLEHFVSTYGVLYGEDQMSHNVHNLLHIRDDYVRYGPLDNCSAFSFESFMQKVLRMVRSPWRPLEQIARRYSETRMHGTNSAEHVRASDIPVCKMQHTNGPLLDDFHCSTQYKQVTFHDMILKVSEPDNVCGSQNGSIIAIENIVMDKNSQCVIIGREFKDRGDFYTVPCKSSVLGVYTVGRLSQMKVWPLKTINRKYVCLKSTSKKTVFPLLHTVY
ncbi:uncharacterized protein LOC124170221 isoform X1 [Ischnura elegans]|uniref:uncharacterized protein LOC124170221 isoform X1 n=1 Tax=Ischnura elegans TaxID=197161 RepID=UPI001ED8AD73|nr:uncharacterized protein LOC124170221 isoform X1 [Ischnura elegans]XP_046404878.1 uncharacterized protein LOC124170221 isoform X1 [Ischnura elegans]